MTWPIPAYSDLILQSRPRGTGQSGPGGAPLGPDGYPVSNYGGNVDYVGGNLVITYPGGSSPVVSLDPYQYVSLLNAFKPWRRNMLYLPFTVGTTAIELLPQETNRTYMLIVNTSLANTLYLGLGYGPTAQSGLPLFSSGGSYEPEVIPTNSISVIGSAAGTTGIILYAN